MDNLETAWAEYEQANPIIVKHDLIEPHDMTTLVRSRLVDARYPEWQNRGVVYCVAPESIWVRVHKSSIERALRLIDALAKACEQRGFRFAPPAQPQTTPSADVMIGENGFALALNERMSRRVYEPTARELSRRKRDIFPLLPKYSYHPSGELQLGLHGRRAKWKNRRGLPLEAQLGAVMIDLRKMSAEADETRRKRQEEDRRIEAHLIDRAELSARVKAEREVVKALRAQTAAWEEARVLRTFVQERTARCGNAEDLRAWAEWALEQADRLDPLTSSPSSILDTPSRQYRHLDDFEYLQEDGCIRSVWD